MCVRVWFECVAEKMVVTAILTRLFDEKEQRSKLRSIADANYNHN